MAPTRRSNKTSTPAKARKTVRRAAPAAPPEITPDAVAADAPKPRKDKSKKIKEGKVIRDSFTIPVREYELIGALKKRCLGFGVAVKKSELLRVGLAQINQLSDEQLADAVSAIESVKTGRPSGKKRSRS